MRNHSQTRVRGRAQESLQLPRAGGQAGIMRKKGRAASCPLSNDEMALSLHDKRRAMTG
jgi:hypothetical protein